MRNRIWNSSYISEGEFYEHILGKDFTRPKRKAAKASKRGGKGARLAKVSSASHSEQKARA